MPQDVSIFICRSRQPNNVEDIVEGLWSFHTNAKEAERVKVVILFACFGVFVQTLLLFALMSWQEERGGGQRGGALCFPVNKAKSSRSPEFSRAGTLQSAPSSISPYRRAFTVGAKMFSTAYQLAQPKRFSLRQNADDP